MADLASTYLGLKLKNPLVPSSSPLTGKPDEALRLEDAGAAAIIMPSLFEEDIRAERARLDRFFDTQALGHAEADSFRSLPESYRTREEVYLDKLAALKARLDIPVIASLNGVSLDGWLEHALLLEEAGADALELNAYYLPGEVEDTATRVETRYVQLARSLVERVRCPVAMKLTSQLTAPLALVCELEATGVKGVSLFNRFYQPDIDLETLDVIPRLELSTPAEALLRIRWAAIIHGRCACDIAVTGGFHRTEEIVKALLAGASVVHLCSVLLREGPAVIRDRLVALATWLEDHEYASVHQLCGSMSQRNAPDPARYARANYLEVLDNYSSPQGVRG
ncbi:MAG: dihydroorotate dehydrogenase-like protein [Halieaceae bacterium]|jgi:dihydroorotate dehydrogenase (fumarate)|nr:dihydroorotate dehydrogenase-like protein [Halieaceae bacterium]